MDSFSKTNCFLENKEKGKKLCFSLSNRLDFPSSFWPSMLLKEVLVGLLLYFLGGGNPEKELMEVTFL